MPFTNTYKVCKKVLSSFAVLIRQQKTEGPGYIISSDLFQESDPGDRSDDSIVSAYASHSTLIEAKEPKRQLNDLKLAKRLITTSPAYRR